MNKEKITEVVVNNILCNISGLQRENIDFDSSLVNLGADSIDIVEIISSSMRSLSIKAPRTQLLNCNTVKDIIEKLEELGGTSSNIRVDANAPNIAKGVEEGVF